MVVNREQTSFSTVRRSAWVADADASPTPNPSSAPLEASKPDKELQNSCTSLYI